MIEKVDHALRGMAEEALKWLIPDDLFLVSFDVPDRDWSSSRIGPELPNLPEVNFHLYELREDISRRQEQTCLVNEHRHEKSAGKKFNVNKLLPHRPPRYFVLSYMVTAWAAIPTQAHRMLEAVLVRLCWEDTLPVYPPPTGPPPHQTEFTVNADPTTGSVLRALHPLTSIRIGQPPDDRGIGELWTALGTPPRPFVDLAVTLPLETFALQPDRAKHPQWLDLGEALGAGSEPEVRHRHTLKSRSSGGEETTP